MIAALEVEDCNSTTSGAVSREAHGPDVSKAAEMRLGQSVALAILGGSVGHGTTNVDFVARPTLLDSRSYIVGDSLLATYGWRKNDFSCRVLRFNQNVCNEVDNFSLEFQLFSIPAEGPIHSDWTHSWIPIGHQLKPVEQAMASLRATVDRIGDLDANEVDAETMLLAEEAIRAVRSRPDESPEEWAARLAGDVEGFND